MNINFNKFEIKRNQGLRFIIFFLAPLIGVLIQYLKILTTKLNKSDIFFLIIMLATFMGLVNGTKLPESDLGSYLDYFNSAKFEEIIPYMKKLEWRDSAFYGITYISYYLFLGNFWLYVVACTFTMYFFYLRSIQIVSESSRLSPRVIATLIVCASFLPDHFIWTGHTLRQMLAYGFVLYLAATTFTENKFRWGLAILAVLTHSSMILFVFLVGVISIIINYIKTKTSKILVFFVLVVVITLIGSEITFQVLEVMRDTAIASRFGGDFADATGIDARNWFLPNFVLFSLALLSVIIFFSKNVSSAQNRFALLYLSYFASMLIFYSFGDVASLISYRILILVYAFIWMLMPGGIELISGVGPRLGRLFKPGALCFIGLLFVFRFFYTISRSNWTFAPIQDLIVNPWLHYFVSVN